jgi:hypothetical protein
MYTDPPFYGFSYSHASSSDLYLVVLLSATIQLEYYRPGRDSTPGPYYL